MVMMKSGFSGLLMRQWTFALDKFREHTVANRSYNRIDCPDEAMRYFYFYVTNPITGTMLRKALEEYERQHPESNPYRFEDSRSAPGHRSYHGIPLPDDAPPRPDDRAEWDFNDNIWITF